MRDIFLKVEQKILRSKIVNSVSTSFTESGDAEYTINFHGRSVALLRAEIDSEVNQVRVRFANKVHVDEWSEKKEVISKLLSLIKISLTSHFKKTSNEHVDIPKDVTYFPSKKLRPGPELAEQILMILSDRDLLKIFVDRLNYAKKAKSKILAWIAHAKDQGWSPGTELTDKSKRALPLVLKKISSKGMIQLSEAVNSTQRNREP